MKPGTNVTITTPPFFATICSTLSGTLRGTLQMRPGRRVRKDHRRLGHAHRVFHRVWRHVAEVDEHAEAIHLANHLFAELRQAAEHRRPGAGIGPGQVGRMRQRHVAGAERVHHAQRRQRVVDRVAAFHADQRPDPAGLERALDVGGGVAPSRTSRASASSCDGRCRSARAWRARLPCPASSTARTPTRTGRPRRPGAGAEYRSSGSAPASRSRPC